MTFQGRSPNDKLALFAADLVRPDIKSGTSTIEGGYLVVKRVTPPQTPCPDLRFGTPGYWGDYDGMTFDPTRGCFVRAFTDSTLGCVVPRWALTSKHVHVSTVCLPPLWEAPAPQTPLAGFQFAGLQEQIKYVNTYGDIQELYLTKDIPGWHNKNLTYVTQAGNQPALDGGIVAFDSTYNDQQHVIYKAASGHDICEMVYSNSTKTWQSGVNNLSGSARNHQTDQDKVLPPKDGAALAGYESPFNSELHVVYIADNGNPIELYYDTSHGTDWYPKNLYQNAPEKPASPIPAVKLVAYATSYLYLPPPFPVYENRLHVIFIGTDRNIHKFYFDTGTDTHWHYYQLTSDSPVADNSALSGYVTMNTTPEEQHINFIKLDSAHNQFHVLELMHREGEAEDKDHWYRNDQLDKDVPADGLVSQSSSLAGYETTYNNQQHVIYFDSQNRVWELFQGGSSQWTPRNLRNEATNAQGEPPPFVASGGSDLTGYQTTWDSKEHVVYLADPYQLIELYYDNSQQKWYWAPLN